MIDKSKKLVCLIDPPWHFNKRNDGTKFGSGAGGKYPLMKDKEILSLFNLLGKSVKNENCAMFIWSTSSHTKLLFKCIEELEKYKFRFATLAFNWMKITKSGDIFVGPGSYTGKSSELCWLVVKGSMPPIDKLVPEGLQSTRGEHSQKPSEIYDRIERMYRGDDYQLVELFARQERNGWLPLGNQVGDGNDIFDDVRKLF